LREVRVKIRSSNGRHGSANELGQLADPTNIDRIQIARTDRMRWGLHKHIIASVI
jgi:hypothetical protein